MVGRTKTIVVTVKACFFRRLCLICFLKIMDIFTFLMISQVQVHQTPLLPFLNCKIKRLLICNINVLHVCCFLRFYIFIFCKITLHINANHVFNVLCLCEFLQ